jgi:hypothetical protein
VLISSLTRAETLLHHHVIVQCEFMCMYMHIILRGCKRIISQWMILMNAWHVHLILSHCYFCLIGRLISSFFILQ